MIIRFLLDFKGVIILILIKRFIDNILRPIIEVRIMSNKKRTQEYKALVDTGAMHFMWCSSKDRLIKAGFVDTGETTEITGINDKESVEVKVYTGNLLLFSSGSSEKSLIAIDNVELVHNEMMQDNYDMIIPYSFLNQFNTLIMKPTDEYNTVDDLNKPPDMQDNIKFGALCLITDSDKNVFALNNVNSKVVGLKDGDKNKFNILFESLKGDDVK